MKKVFIFILLLFGLIACIPEPIEIDVQSAESKLVVFTHIVPDNIMLVALSKSFSVLEGNTEEDYENLLVSGATVKILFDGKTFDFYELRPGIYASYTQAYQIDQEYELVAYIGKDTIRSKTKMLPKVNFTNVIPRVEKMTADTNIFLNLEFQDLPNVSNWYLINIYRKQAVMDSIDNVNYFSFGNNQLAKSILVSDKEFSGVYKRELLVNELFPKDSIAVTLSNINQTYFNYLGYRVSGGTVLNQLNIEPVTYPTNIINGYGFFNTHFPDIKFFDLGQY